MRSRNASGDRLDRLEAERVKAMRYEVGYNKPIHGNWGLQYEKVLETDDMEEARSEIRRQKTLGHNRGLVLYDSQEKVFCVDDEHTV